MPIEQRSAACVRKTNPWAGEDEDIDGLGQQHGISARTLEEEKDSDDKTLGQGWLGKAEAYS